MAKLTAQHVLDRYWDKQLPVDVFKIAEKMGIEVEYLDTFEYYSGKYTMDNNDPTCHINRLDSIERQRFTLAHEIGHHMLDHGEAFRNTNHSKYSPDERAANVFATHLLMPEDRVNNLIKNLNITDPVFLAKHFEVSYSAMRIRLVELGWL